MKILAIRGKNLASLEGEFDIDFTAEPLKSAGIFAITGCTGAGKSTILDALCLALFDDTPRTNRAMESIAIPDVKDKTINQKDCRTILRRGMGDGYAEVDFVSLGGEKFRSRWMVKRARGKADGSMQNAEIRLTNLSTGVELQGRKTELLARLVELIGLTFDQFTRSVLLAQGDFATFLKARQAEKAELLEKLTGTEVYSRISVMIFEKCKLAEQDYSVLHARIEDIELLSDEQLAELSAEGVALVEELKALKAQSENIAEKIKWFTGEETIRNGIHQAEEQMLSLQKQISESAPRYDYLSQIELAQEIRDVFGEWRQTTRQIVDKEILLKKQRNDLDANAVALKQTGHALEECNLELHEFNKKVEQIEPQIVKARELDVRITGEKNNLAEARKEYTAALRSKEKLDKSISSHNREKETATQSLGKLSQWFETNRVYETLVPRAELVINLLDDMQSTGQQLEENTRILSGCKATLEQGRHKLTAAQAEAERLQRLLPAEIMEWRARLEEGKPCPVCGSLHHPSTQLAAEQSLQEEELEKAKKHLAGQITVLSGQVEQWHNETTRLTALIGNYQKHSEQMQKKAGTYLAALPGWEESFAKGCLQKQLKEIAAQWLTNANEQMQLKERLSRLQATLEMEQESAAEAVAAVCEKESKQKALSEELGQLLQERATLLKGQTVEQAMRACADKKKAFEKLLKERTEALSELRVKQEGYRATITQLEQETAGLLARKEALEKHIGQWLEGQGKIKDWEELTGLLSKDNHWLQNEKQFLNGLREQETALKATLEERKQNLVRHHEAIIKPSPDIESRESLQEELTVKSQAVQQKTERQAEVNYRLVSHQKSKERIKAFEQELQEKEVVATNWKKLNELFGSASGSKFKEIAQGYTLDVLLVYANKHLKGLSGRYELQRIPDTLALQVTDLDMLGESRAVHSLSGGESFLISLALALGLASLSSNRMSVESLFIDEGFGSLDMDTLRVALDALERLQTQGRKIGVISHVTEMTERITAQIQVLKSSNGRSEVCVVG